MCRMSTGCRKTIFPYVNMSVCQYFSLGIKMKVVPNVIRRKLLKSVCERERECESQKKLRRAKEPALVW